jgi:hypothetical protein
MTARQTSMVRRPCGLVAVGVAAFLAWGMVGCDAVLSAGRGDGGAAERRTLDLGRDRQDALDSATPDAPGADASGVDACCPPDRTLDQTPPLDHSPPPDKGPSPDGVVPHADAKPGGVVVAASCAQSAVQSAINAASSGETVLLPGGNCSWASAVTIPGSKGLTLDGDGATIHGAVELSQGASASSRVTRFNFVQSSTTAQSVTITGSKSSAPYRVDHNTFSYDTGGSVVIEVSGNGPGLIDANQLACPANCEMIHNMGMGPTDASGWGDDVSPGGAAAVYIEDNLFQNTGATGNPAYFWGSSAVQSYYGARTVFRHNTLIMSQLDQHGTAGMIGARWWEIYENTFSTDVPNASQCCFITLRAGSGVVFNNHHVGVNLNGDSIDLYEEDTGYPALYQVGRGKDQALDPAHLWGNDVFFSIGSQTPAMVQLNRDYYLSPRPGYLPFTHPYPLGADGLPSP